MKVLIPIVIGLLVVGCGKKQSTNTNESNNTPEKTAKKNVEKETPSKGDDNNSTTSKPADDTNATKLTPEERKVVGEYEFKNEIGLVRKDVYLANGNFEDYLDGEKQEEGKWKVVDGELHVEGETFVVLVSRINKDGSITDIAYIPKDEKRVDLPKEDQDTWKKIK